MKIGGYIERHCNSILVLSTCSWKTVLFGSLPWEEALKQWSNRNSEDRRLRRKTRKMHKCKDQVSDVICSPIFLRLKEVICIAFLKKVTLYSKGPTAIFAWGTVVKISTVQKKSWGWYLRGTPCRIQQVILGVNTEKPPCTLCIFSWWT